jgi:hypothetical protein
MLPEHDKSLKARIWLKVNPALRECREQKLTKVRHPRANSLTASCRRGRSGVVSCCKFCSATPATIRLRSPGLVEATPFVNVGDGIYIVEQKNIAEDVYRKKDAIK